MKPIKANRRRHMNLDKEIALLLGWEFNEWKRNFELVNPEGSKWSEWKRSGEYDPATGKKLPPEDPWPELLERADFSPSKRIEQAMELLEGLEHWELVKTRANGYLVFITRGQSKDPEGQGQTPSEAICKAWIKYKEGEQ